jgi:hypothetical protein
MVALHGTAERIRQRFSLERGDHFVVNQAPHFAWETQAA